MLNDDALRFIRLGTFIERADNTARIPALEVLSLPSDVSISHRPLITTRGADVCTCIGPV